MAIDLSLFQAKIAINLCQEVVSDGTRNSSKKPNRHSCGRFGWSLDGKVIKLSNTDKTVITYYIINDILL
jgi:hypothetical protein